MGLLGRLFGRVETESCETLYQATVARARRPHWYIHGKVPDTIDGRFDMIAALLSMVLLRLESDPQGAAPGALLSERFVDDMDGQLREIGFGDLVVGKHIGKMMGMLGGRLGAYRQGLVDGGLQAALIRNLYRGEDPGDEAVAYVEHHLRDFRAALDAVSLDRLTAGDLP
ncbi:ubiquinol-cytochrome C chaperone family protein [Stakelama saccharophila]|uniref:Ubiquinol-cytochrome C chaperone family protein n=1 Tax=Stakelama saccharophila TaxID=3075605 RepID=A0ABZ0BCT6_9SPHN|nr:ubiquinol-cytochrome C chaperone family protein [Stakelama sp. W311]WNO55098.1 ubiquinol-cytochrome C chaperone family protein [Stakelama sp. W311]